MTPSDPAIRLPTLVVAALVSVACSTEEPGGGRRGGRGGPPPGSQAAIPVEVETLGRGRVARVVSSTARLAPAREVSVVSRVSARLLDLSADLGDVIEKGQLLAELDDSEARHDLEEAEAEARRTRQEEQRALRSFEAGLLAPESYEQARTSKETADARASQARLRLSWTRATAPLGGVVTRRVAEVGQIMSPGDELVAIADVSTLRAEVDLPERDLGLVSVGQVAEILVDPYPGVVFRGSVTRIAPMVDCGSGTFRVRVELEPRAEGRPRLLPGLFARVRLLIDRRDDVVVVPRRALLMDREGEAVFVLRDGQAVLVAFEAGYVDGGLVEARSGLSAGDKVIVLGQDSLAPGAAVREVGESASPDGAAAAPPVATRGESDGSAGRESPGGGAMDPERVARMLDRFKQNPDFAKRWDEAVKKDPDLATDTDKQLAFLREAMASFGGGGRRGRGGGRGGGR